MASTVVVLVGVPAPRPFKYDGEVYRFAALPGVLNDVRQHRQLLCSAIPSEPVVREWVTPYDTKVDVIGKRLLEVVTKLQPDDLLVLVLCGHGFQVRDDDMYPEQDFKDEVFACSDGPLRDDFFQELWAKCPVGARVVSIVDTCGSDTLVLGLARPEPLYYEVFTAAGPSRLSISACLSAETAQEIGPANQRQGLLSWALAATWTPAPDLTYRTWFTTAAKRVTHQNSRQHPTLRYLGPRAGLPLVDSRPF
ncbi:caspase family protein [Kribbella sp. NPDC050124]|uniref:caspase family protein n=1 Tax=Kribbella sp. NPDC050124 TaxID=3364114 RepID=UPI00379990C9